MKFRSAPIIYRAVCEGLVQGLQASKRAETSASSPSAEQVVEITAGQIMQKLNDVMIFDEEEEKMMTLQRIAEGMVEQKHTAAEPQPESTTP